MVWSRWQRRWCGDGLCGAGTVSLPPKNGSRTEICSPAVQCRFHLQRSAAQTPAGRCPKSSRHAPLFATGWAADNLHSGRCTLAYVHTSARSYSAGTELKVHVRTNDGTECSYEQVGDLEDLDVCRPVRGAGRCGISGFPCRIWSVHGSGPCMDPGTYECGNWCTL